MNLKKLISKGLIVGLLFNNIGYSFADSKGLDERYETFEGDNITINNILEEDKVDVEIEGNTMVNLVKCENINVAVPQTGYYKTNLGSNSQVKPDTTYTIIHWAEKTENHNPISIDDNRAPFEVVFGGKYSDDEWGARYRPHFGEISSYHVGTFTTPSDYYQNGGKEFILIGEYSRGSNFDISIVVLEGDWTNKELPKSYFEGIKSVGSLENDRYSINLKSTNKNLFNGEFEEGYISTGEGSNGDVTYKEGYRSTGFIRVKPDTYYTCSKANRYAITFYDLNKNKIGDSSHQNTFLTPQETKYIKCYYYNPGLELDADVNLDEFQIEEGLNTTSYIPHKSIEKELILNSPLKAISPTIKDRIIKRNGQWVIERNLANG